MARLASIEIDGYRSIKDVSLALGPLNVLIGANGAGKSNFVAFFKMLNEMMSGRLQEYVGRTGRAGSILHFGPKVTPQLEGRLHFEVENGFDSYHMRLFHAAGDSLVFAEEVLSFQATGHTIPKVVSLGTGHQETRLGEEAKRGGAMAETVRFLLNQCRVYHFHDTSPTAPIRQSCFIQANRWLMPDAGNLAAMLYAYRQRHDVVYQRIVATVRKIMPEFHDFDLEPDRFDPRNLFLNWRQRRDDYLFGPHQISDGTLRAIAILTLLLQPEDELPAVIILDEPELGLHPQALGLVAGLMRAASLKSQLIVATQSQSLLDYFEPDEIITVESHEGRSAFRRLEAEALRDWLEDYSIGELWQRNVLGGGPLP